MTLDQTALDRYLRDELPEIVRILGESRIHELEVRDGAFRLRIKRAEPANSLRTAYVLEGQEDQPPLSEPAPSTQGTRVVPSPMVGVFYHSEQPGRAPLVSEGSRVEPGALIGVIEALQVLTEVESDAHGVVQKMLAGDGQPVEYGQPLVEVLLEG